MRLNRREFIVTSTAAVCAVSLYGSERPISPAATPSEPFLLPGDPYTAHVDDHGLGGRTWEDALDHAMRFRSTDRDRDRYVLGLEV